MNLSRKCLMPMCVALSSIVLVSACGTEESKLFHVNCSAPDASGVNGTVSVSPIKERCSEVIVRLPALVNTIWLCPTKLCDACLHILRSTDVAKVKAPAREDNPVPGSDLGQEEEGGLMEEEFIVSISDWSQGVRTTLWLANLYTPGFSESFVPVVEHDAGNDITVDGVGQGGEVTVRYASCKTVPGTVHLPSTCQPNSTDAANTTTATASGDTAVFADLSTAVVQSQQSGHEILSSKLIGFITAVSVLAVLLIACSVLLLVLLHRRHRAKPDNNSAVVDLAFPRTESSEEMVGPLRSNRGLSFSNPSFAVSAPRTGSFMSEGDDTEVVLTEPTVAGSHSSAYGAFYIDVMNT